MASRITAFGESLSDYTELMAAADAYVGSGLT